MTENFIRCAAVATYSGSTEFNEPDNVYFWIRHPQIYATIGAMWKIDDLKLCAQWFADKYWNFLTRSEAYKVAKEAWQLIKDTGSRGVLYSEDLY